MQMSSARSEEHTSELQSHLNLVCRLLLEKKQKEKASGATSWGPRVCSLSRSRAHRCTPSCVDCDNLTVRCVGYRRFSYLFFFLRRRPPPTPPPPPNPLLPHH